VDGIHIALQLAIIDGDLAPRTRLRETELARHFGTSNTPVREALRRLEFDGLVELQPRRGAVVAEPNIDEVVGLYETRALLECAAAEAAARARSHDLGPVEKILAEEAVSVEEPDERHFNACDIAFHRALSDLGGNIVLAREAQRLHRQIQAVRSRASVQLPDQPLRSHEQHLKILDAVVAHDSQLARRLVAAHIESIRDAVIHVLHAQAAAPVS
jgi:DNA-binding GntR family transcriptional regulator